MKTLLILRHAITVPKDPNLSDHDSSLDKLRKNDALHMSKLIKDKDIIPSYVISLTSLRDKTTAELVVMKERFFLISYYLSILETRSDKYISVVIVGIIQ